MEETRMSGIRDLRFLSQQPLECVLVHGFCFICFQRVISSENSFLISYFYINVLSVTLLLLKEKVYFINNNPL